MATENSSSTEGVAQGGNTGPAGTSTDDGQQAPQGATQPPAEDNSSEGSDDGKGGKAAVLADLAAERDKRQAAEQANIALKDQFDKIAKALGIGDDDATPDPEQLTAELSKAQAAQHRAAVELAVHRNAGGADPARLMKFTDFLDAVADIDPTDTDKVKAAIADTVNANPWLNRTPVSNGDAHEGHQGSPRPNPSPGKGRLAEAFENATGSTR